MGILRSGAGARVRVSRRWWFAAVFVVPACLLARAALSTDRGFDVWLADSRGVAALSTADGELALEIGLSPDPRAIAVDGQEQRLWVYADRVLRAYDFAGHLRASTTISPPAGNPALLAVDPQAARVWLAVSTQIHLLNSAGTLLKQWRLANPVIDIALDRRRSLIWVASKGSLQVFDTNGDLAQQVDVTDLKVLRALAYDASRDEIWLAADDLVRRYDAHGVVVESTRNEWFIDVAAVVADHQGGAWLVTNRQLGRLLPAGGLALVLTPNPGANKEAIVDLAADPHDGSAWIASNSQLHHYASDGTLLRQYLPTGADGKNRVLRRIALESRPIAPQIRITAPLTGSLLKDARPPVQVAYSGEDIELSSLQLAVDGAAVVASCQALPQTATCALAQPVSDGAHDIAATIANSAGNRSQPATVSVTIDTLAPTIQITSPPDQLLTNSTAVTVTGTISEQAAVTINGIAATVQANQFSSGPHALAEGANVLLLRAIDLAGNAGTAQRTVVRDTTPPGQPAAPLVQAQVAGGQVAISGRAGSVEGGARVTIVNTRTGASTTVMANADGSFSATIVGDSGDALQIRATDAAGNQSAATEVTVASAGPFSGPLRITGVSPANGTTVSGDMVLVAVDVQAPPNTGVVVNQAVAAPTAISSGLRYYAEVPLVTGSNTLTIRVRGQDGRVLVQQLTLTSNAASAYHVAPDQPVGLSPFKVRFRILDQLGLGIREVRADFDNNGTIDFVATDRSVPIVATFTGVGLRRARFVIFDDAGVGRTFFSNVVLMDTAIVDRDLLALWGGVKSALMSGEREAALQFLSQDSRQRYATAFTDLLPRLPQVLGSLSEPTRAFVAGDYAEYAVNRTSDGQNKLFLLGFVTNEFGQWQLDSM